MEKNVENLNVSEPLDQGESDVDAQIYEGEYADEEDLVVIEPDQFWVHSSLVDIRFGNAIILRDQALLMSAASRSSEVLKVAAKGDKYQVVGYKMSGKNLWVLLSSLRLTQRTVGIFRAIVMNLPANDVLNIRKSPNDNSEILTTLKTAELVNVNESQSSGDWYKVILSNGIQGYGHKKFLVPTDSLSVSKGLVPAKVKGIGANDKLWIRTFPGYEGEIIASLRLNEVCVVDIRNSSAQWFSVIHNGIRGYAHAQNFRFEPSEAIGVVSRIDDNDKLNIRSEASTNGRILGKLENGSLVKVVLDLSIGNNWLYVKSGSISGYVHSGYVTIANSFASIEEGEEPADEGEDNNWDTESGIVLGRREVQSLPGGGVKIVGVPLINQKAKDPFDPNGGRGWVPGAFCGPTSMQMILASWGISESRDTIALTRLNSSGTAVISRNYKSTVHRGQVYAKNKGASHGAMTNMFRYLGLKKTKYETGVSQSRIKELLEEGRPIMTSIKGYVKYTDGTQRDMSKGHVFVIVGMEGDGDILVNDPWWAGKTRTLDWKIFNRIWNGHWAMNAYK